MSTKMPIGQFVGELEAAYKRGDGYIMGARGQNPRTGKLDLNDTNVSSSWKETGYYYTQYSGSQRKQALKWRKSCARVWDCNGMAEGIYEMFSGTNINMRARDNYASWCDPKGSGMIPKAYRVPGAAVFWGDSASSIHHVAYLYKPVDAGKPEGDWYLIEARGVMYGVVKTKLQSRKPDYWGMMTKYFDYANAEIKPKELHLGDRLLKNGCEGTDVKELQTALIELDYDCGRWGADGDFGDATEMAVRDFQEDNSLEVDGEYGEKSHAAMLALLAERNLPADDPRFVEIYGGDCYARAAPDTSAKIIGVAYRGERFQYGGQQSENGWHLIAFGNQNAWVSGKYSRMAGDAL